MTDHPRRRAPRAGPAGRATVAPAGRATVPPVTGPAGPAVPPGPTPTPTFGRGPDDTGSHRRDPKPAKGGPRHADDGWRADGYRTGTYELDQALADAPSRPRPDGRIAKRREADPGSRGPSRHRRGGGPLVWALLAGGLVAVLFVGSLVWFLRSDDGDGNTPTTAAAEQAAEPVDPAHPFYIVPGTNAAKQVATWQREGKAAEAAAVRRIADQPTAVWFAYDGPDVGPKATKLIADAAKVGRIPVLTAYFIPDRDCGQYSSGGAADADAYQAWIGKLAAATAGHPAYVILEPDAIAHTLDGCVSDPDQITQRYALLSTAISTLKANPNVKVYLDGGNSAWIGVDKMAAALRSAGVAKADGFAVNVSNFETTASSVAYGAAISRRTGGKHFVIDTSRNGNGPAPKSDGDTHWCNPAGRKLGATPTTKTGNALVDAYLWVKQPGDSDGACRGAPEAGTWWPQYALQLANG